MGELANSRNLGPKTAEWLAEIGITSEDQIHQLGAVEVYRRLKAYRPQAVSLNALWALAGLEMGIRWDQIPQDVKEDLRRQVGGL